MRNKDHEWVRLDGRETVVGVTEGGEGSLRTHLGRGRRFRGVEFLKSLPSPRPRAGRG
jgi:hypothetical protein